MSRAQPDKRGQVAVVTASTHGPRVMFIDRRPYVNSWIEALMSALRCVAAVYANSEGDDRYTWPRAVWIQQHPGVWVRA